MWEPYLILVNLKERKMANGRLLRMMVDCIVYLYINWKRHLTREKEIEKESRKRLFFCFFRISQFYVQGKLRTEKIKEGLDFWRSG